MYPKVMLLYEADRNRNG